MKTKSWKFDTGHKYLGSVACQVRWGIIEWKKQELRDLDSRTRKFLTMNGGLHPRDSVERLYVTRKEGGRGLISVENCVNQTRISLERYVRSTEEELLKAVRSEGVES